MQAINYVERRKIMMYVRMCRCLLFVRLCMSFSSVVCGILIAGCRCGATFPASHLVCVAGCMLMVQLFVGFLRKMKGTEDG